MDLWRSTRRHSEIRMRSASIFQNILRHFGRVRRQTVKDRIYTHGEKEVAAEKDRRENGIPVNDNTMVELADLCSYLKLDFGSYFEGYELPKDSKFFTW